MRNCAAKEALNRHVARTPDEVYSVVANLLYINGIVGRDAVMNAKTALDLGYASASAFIYMFRQEMGCSPQHYRRMLRTRS